MTSLKAKLMEDGQKRKAQNVQRRKIVQTSLILTRDSRQKAAVELREELQQFRDDLADQGAIWREQTTTARQRSSQELWEILNRNHAQRQAQTQSFLAQMRAEMTQTLSDFRQSLTDQVQILLETTQSDRRIMSQTLRQMLQDFHLKLEQTIQELLSGYHQSRCVETQYLKESLTQFHRDLAQDIADRLAINHLERQQLRSEIEQYLSDCRVDRQTMRQERLKKATQQRQELAQFRASLTEAVFGVQSSESIASSSPLSGEKNTIKATLPSDLSNSLTLEKVFRFVEQHPGSRLIEIEAGVGLNRIQIVDTLQCLNEQGLITQEDRAYFIVGGNQ